MQQQTEKQRLAYRPVRNGLSVSCDGRLVGHIRLTLGGAYRYFPLGVKAGGATFETLGQCKRSLEAA